MAREAGRGVLTVLRFAGPVAAHQVLVECARQAADGDRGHGGLVVGYAGREAAAGLDVAHAPVDDAADAGDPERDVPPDVVVAVEDVARRPAHHVIDRAPTVVTDPGLEPVDEQVVNPGGWRKDWDEPVRDLAARTGRSPRRRSRTLRGVQGLRSTWPPPTRGPSPALAMAGVPLLADRHQPVAERRARRRAGRSRRPRRPARPRAAQRHHPARRPRPPLHPRLAARPRRAGRRPVRGAAEGQRPARHDAPAPARLRDAPARPPAGATSSSGARHPRLEPTPTTYARALGDGRTVVARPHDKDAFFGDVLNDARAPWPTATCC